ncbi:MAG: hypothetical protein RLZZ450_1008 [Pseudomonadota bacterium]|jgi:hypothetical protein
MCVLPVSAARAQAVALDLVGCAEPAAADVRALASLELRGRLREGSDASAEQHIVVTCAGDRAALRAVERGDVRAVELDTVPPALRARLLALSIAELAKVSGAEGTTDDERTASTQAELPRDNLPEAPSSAPPVLQSRAASRAVLAVGARLSTLPSLGGAASLASLVRVFGPLSWTGALALGQSRCAIDRGHLRARSLVLRSGPALTLERARWLSYVALAARVELLQLAGEPRDNALWRAARVRTFVAGPALFAGVLLALGSHALVGLEAELAHQLRAIDVEVRGGQTSTLSPWRLTFDVLVGARW